MIGARVAVLAHRTAELRHRQHDHVLESVSQVPRERRQRLCQLGEPCGELPLARPLVHMGVPPRDVGERHLQPDVGLDQLGDLEHRLTEFAAGIVGTVRRLVLCGVDSLQRLHGLERFLG